jgi:alpha-1,6-mannosyltransferase
VSEHLGVVWAASRYIARFRPEVVIVQNYVLPEFEMPVLLTAHRYRAFVLVVAHEPETRFAPKLQRPFLARELQHADLVICHSRFVAGALGTTVGKIPIEIIPLPVPSAVVNRAGEVDPVVPLASGPLALHFGHLNRSYKGTSVVTDLVRSGVPGWRFALVGTGAPEQLAGAACVSRFLSDAELASTVAEAQAVVLPYTHASQSAAVTLAQAMGCVVLASRIGGIPEQVPDGTGLLLEPLAPAARWREVLLGLDEDSRAEIASKARRFVTSNQEKFVEGVGAAVSIG